MAVVVRPEVILALRKLRSKERATRIGLSEQHLSPPEPGKARGVPVPTLEAICRELDCGPGGPLACVEDEPAS